MPLRRCRFAPCLWWPLLVVATPSLLLPQDIGTRKRVYYRVPFWIDLQEPLLSSMLLGVDRVKIDLSLDAYADAKVTVRENAIAEFLAAVAAGDAAALQGAVSPNDSGMEDAAGRGALLANLGAEFGREQVGIVAEYPLSEARSILAWRVGKRGRELHTHLEWGSTTGAARWFPSGFPQPADYLSSLLIDISKLVGGGAQLEVQIEPDAFRYSTPLGAGSAELHFNGKTYRWRLGKDPVPPGEVTEFYAGAAGALLERGLGAFADYFTPGSANVLHQLGESFSDAERESFLNDLRRQNRMVVFVLDADPCFAVFYNTFNAGSAYDLVVRDPDSGQLRLTGFQMIGDLDALMRDRDHFWRPIISPLASRGPDPDGQLSMPIVPAFLKAERAAGISGANASRGVGSRGAAGSQRGNDLMALEDRAPDRVEGQRDSGADAWRIGIWAAIGAGAIALVFFWLKNRRPQ